MAAYTLVQAAHGYLVKEMPAAGVGHTGESYAFSTLKEVQDYLPNLFAEETTQ